MFPEVSCLMGTGLLLLPSDSSLFTPQGINACETNSLLILLNSTVNLKILMYTNSKTIIARQYEYLLMKGFS